MAVLSDDGDQIKGRQQALRLGAELIERITATDQCRWHLQQQLVVLWRGVVAVASGWSPEDGHCMPTDNAW